MTRKTVNHNALWLPIRQRLSLVIKSYLFCTLLTSCSTTDNVKISPAALIDIDSLLEPYPEFPDTLAGSVRSVTTFDSNPTTYYFDKSGRKLKEVSMNDSNYNGTKIHGESTVDYIYEKGSNALSSRIFQYSSSKNGKPFETFPPTKTDYHRSKNTLSIIQYNKDNSEKGRIVIVYGKLPGNRTLAISRPQGNIVSLYGTVSSEYDSNNRMVARSISGQLMANFDSRNFEMDSSVTVEEFTYTYYPDGTLKSVSTTASETGKKVLTKHVDYLSGTIKPMKHIEWNKDSQFAFKWKDYTIDDNGNWIARSKCRMGEAGIWLDCKLEKRTIEYW